MAQDIEEMEQLGIWECDDEDFALCSFACPSKIDVGQVIRHLDYDKKQIRKWLRNLLDQLAPHFEKDGKLEKFGPVFEATDTILFSTDERTESGLPHKRYGGHKGVMILVVIALIPCYIFGVINVGYQNLNF